MKFNLKHCAVLLSAFAMAATSAAARTVVDDNDTKVEIPDQVNRVVVTNILPLASAVTVFLNDGKTVVGMHPASYSAAKTGLLGKLYPDVLKADTGAATKLALIADFDRVLSLGLIDAGERLREKSESAPAADDPRAASILERISARAAAKKAKNYAEADRIRAELAAEGVTLVDTPQGTTYKLD